MPILRTPTWKLPWSTPTTAARRISVSSPSWGFRWRGRLFSCATLRATGAERVSKQKNTASPESWSTPTRWRTATSRVTSGPTALGARLDICNAAPTFTTFLFRATPSPRAGLPCRRRSASGRKTLRSSPRSPWFRSPPRTRRNFCGGWAGRPCPRAGRERPDEFVLLSNHHDAWVYGAVDPASGTATMLELARVLGELAREGYRPRRTILFGNWDAEEYTLTGSTEWGEQFADELRRDAIACLNVDASTSGADFSVSASPLLRRLILEATQAVADPQTGQPVYDRWAKSASGANVRSYVSGAAGASGPLIERLGSGSDYTVFFNHLGIPSLDMLFDGPYGVYHSVYDGHVWMSRFGDPGFRFHAAMARLWGVMALRLANADLLPLDPRAEAEALDSYVEELRPEAPPEFFARHLAPLQSEARGLGRAAARFDSRARGWLRDPKAHRPALARANRALLQLERDFTHPDGLPNRPWFKHLVYAPKPSYRAQVLPAIAEALERNDAAGAAEQARRLREAIRTA